MSLSVPIVTRKKFVIGGKGRFANAKGEGGFTGVRISPLGVGADAFFDQMITVKK